MCMPLDRHLHALHDGGINDAKVYRRGILFETMMLYAYA